MAKSELLCPFHNLPVDWMIPPEARGELCLLITASDANFVWSMGVVRVTEDRLRSGTNPDAKAQLNEAGRTAIRWLFENAPLPSNVFLQLEPGLAASIMSLKSGQKRINELLRRTLGMRVGRAAIATAGQQKDPMKRLRKNGGARTHLKKEGIIILGQYHFHCEIARALRVPVPGPSETVPVRVVPATTNGPGCVLIDDRIWRIATADDPTVEAPELPDIDKAVDSLDG